MKEVITAGELFHKVYYLLADKEIAPDRQNEQMHELFVLVCHEGIRDTDQAFGNLFSQVDFLCKFHHISIPDKISIQTARRHSNSKEIIPRKDLLYDFRALAIFISAVFNKDIPEYLTSVIPHHNQQPNSYSAINRKSIRCCVNRWDSRTITVSIDQDSCEEEYLILLKDDSHNTDHTYLTDLIHEGSQMNLLDCTLSEVPLEPPDEGKKCYRVCPRFIILEPDFLIDISTIAACFTDYGHHPLLYLLNEMKPKANTQATLLGNFAGSALDDIINSKNDYQVNDTIRNNFKEKALEYCTCPEFNSVKFHQDAHTQTDNLRQAVYTLFQTIPDNDRNRSPAYDRSKSILEPSFICEALGIQGRVDLMTTDMKLLVEQKSGRNMHIERHFPDRRYHSMQVESHYVQLLLYYGVLHYNFRLSNNTVDIRLLYSKYPPRDGLMVVAYYQQLFYEALKYRNLLVATQLDMGKNGFDSYLDLFSPEVLNTNNMHGFFYDRYLQPQILALTKPLHELSVIERKYFSCMMTFVLREQIVSKLGYQEGTGTASSDLWNMPLAEKKDTGNIYTGLHITRRQKSTPYNGYDTLTLNIPEQGMDFLPNFRIGDMIFLYTYDKPVKDRKGQKSPIPDIRESILYKGILQEIKSDEITVHLTDGQQNPHIFEEGTYAIEHAASDSSAACQIRALHAFITADKKKRDLFLGQRSPQKDCTLQLSRSYDKILDPILLKAKQAKDYFLLVGPPGTGKTSRALQFMVREALADSKTILLLSYTNRAVDEISEMLANHNIDFLRIGNEYSCDERFRPYLLGQCINKYPKKDALQQYIRQMNVIIGTTSMISAKSYIFQLKHFDLAIIDESSQILEPNIIGLIIQTDKCILIGDYKQLPAVVQQREKDSKVDDSDLEAIGLTNCRNSLFERLIHMEQVHHRKDFTSILRYQGRMHPEIAEFPNKMFYFQEQLQPVPCPHQLETTLHYEQKSEDLLDDVLKKHRMIFIPSKNNEQNNISDKANSEEALITAQLLRRIHRFYQNSFDARTTVGVIVPYRNQIAMIRKEIEKLHIPELQNVSIDTVERYQGSQRDVIIYSFTIQHFYQLEFLTANSFTEEGKIIDRKLNVALTRARKQMIMTGNTHVLNGNTLFRQLIDFCKMKNGYFEYDEKYSRKN